jgi:hypothetical protein
VKRGQNNVRSKIQNKNEIRDRNRNQTFTTTTTTTTTTTNNNNVIKNEADKVLKYKDLTREIQRMWNVKTNVIPVIIGATGTISKSFRKYLTICLSLRSV